MDPLTNANLAISVTRSPADNPRNLTAIGSRQVELLHLLIDYIE